MRLPVIPHTTSRARAHWDSACCSVAVHQRLVLVDTERIHRLQEVCVVRGPRECERLHPLDMLEFGTALSLSLALRNTKCQCRYTVRQQLLCRPFVVITMTSARRSRSHGLLPSQIFCLVIMHAHNCNPAMKKQRWRDRKKNDRALRSPALPRPSVKNGDPQSNLRDLECKS